MSSAGCRNVQKGKPTGRNGLDRQPRLPRGVKDGRFLLSGSGFSKGTTMSTHLFPHNINLQFLLKNSRVWGSSRSHGGRRTAPQRGRTQEPARLPLEVAGPSWAAAWSWDGA